MVAFGVGAQQKTSNIGHAVCVSIKTDLKKERWNINVLIHNDGHDSLLYCSLHPSKYFKLSKTEKKKNRASESSWRV